MCVCVCARVFADPLRDGGRRQKAEWEGGREHERVGAESREGGRAREMMAKVARATSDES